MQELFNQRAFPELLCEILMMFDEMLKLLFGVVLGQLIQLVV